MHIILQCSIPYGGLVSYSSLPWKPGRFVQMWQVVAVFQQCYLEKSKP
jgi:hypothetical protein